MHIVIKRLTFCYAPQKIFIDVNMNISAESLSDFILVQEGLISHQITTLYSMFIIPASD